MLEIQLPNEAEAVSQPVGKTPLSGTTVNVRCADGKGFAADVVIEEVPVALVYNGISHAVMMATPDDLEDFAVGFSLTEGIVRSRDEIYELALESGPDGISLEMTIATECFVALKQRRRNLTGRTGCGLCGTESLAEAIRPIPRVPHHVVIDDKAIQRAVQDLKEWQPLQAETGATHAAAWCDRDGAIMEVREDVGRHNALDKLVGACLGPGTSDRSSSHTVADGFVLISSRGSFEMVQKSAAVGIGCLVAVSAPTALAIREAEKAGMTLIGFARPGRHVVYTSPHKNSEIRSINRE